MAYLQGAYDTVIDFDDGSIETYDDVKYRDGVLSMHEQRGPVTVPQALGRLRVALEDSYLRASRRHGLTPQQAELLCAALEPTPVGTLARVLRCDQSNVTRLVDRAAKRDLLRRRSDRDDGRVTLIELSPKGRRLAERFISTLEHQLADLLAEWPSERQRELVASLNEIADNLDRVTPT